MDFTINPLDLELILRIIVSVALGAIIGFDREKKQKPAGLRTHIFVCMGACLFTISSFSISSSESIGIYDVTRIAAGIVTGISFIGAGSIIASKGDVRGLTTAASLWVVAGIGLMVGFGNFLIPIVVAIISFIILRLDSIEKKKINNHKNE